MADENLITDPVDQSGAQSEAEKRIKQLSEKVRLTSEEGAEKDRLLKESGDKIASLEKENSFNSGFSEMIGSYPKANEHREDIKAKVLAGYSVEDATLAVLGKAGKLGAPALAPRVAGGSADTAMSSGASKEMKDMSLAEKRAVLEQNIVWS